MKWNFDPMRVLDVEPEDNLVALGYVSSFKDKFVEFSELVNKNGGKVEIDMDDIYTAFLNGVKYAKSAK